MAKEKFYEMNTDSESALLQEEERLRRRKHPINATAKDDEADFNDLLSGIN